MNVIYFLTSKHWVCKNIIAVALCGTLAGCGTLSSDLANLDDGLVTGSTSSTIKPLEIEMSDWDQLETIMQYAVSDEVAGSPIPWENNSTGTSGTAMVFKAPTDQDCHNFAVTFQSIRGIHRYKGEICEFGMIRKWKVKKFKLVDQT